MGVKELVYKFAVAQQRVFDKSTILYWPTSYLHRSIVVQITPPIHEGNNTIT
jgi:hypothetical protein